MRSDRLSVLPALTPLEHIARPVSTPEYFHACIGKHPRSLESAREVYFVLEGENTLMPDQWRRALDQLAAANPGTRLRLVGRRRAARWQSDGVPPQFRVVEGCNWDARSSTGSEFLSSTPISLEHGPTVELILAPRAGNTTLLIFRTHHAIMDGKGVFHALRELFRALRGEAPLGSNASFSDVDLMRSLGVRRSTSRPFRTTYLTGALQGDEQGDDWRRISLGQHRPQQLAQVAVAFAEFAHRHSDLPALIAVPVDLRRHLPDLRSTTNFTNMLLVRVDKGDGVEAFSSRLQEMLSQRMEAVFRRSFDILRSLPLSWFDLLVSRTPKNYRTKKLLETAVISYLGSVDLVPLSAPGFTTRHLFVLPVAGSALGTLTRVHDEVEITLNLPRTLSSHGRFDELESFLHQRFAGQNPAPYPSEPRP